FAAARSLRDVPHMNGSYQDDRLQYFDTVNIGVVMARDEGMVIPVVRDAANLDVHSISERTQKLYERARNGRLTSSELSGSTFTLSNLGMFGIDSFVAVINPPEAAILALGAAR